MQHFRYFYGTSLLLVTRSVELLRIDSFDLLSMVSDPENPLVLNVLHASSTAYSHNPVEKIEEVYFLVSDPFQLIAFRVFDINCTYLCSFQKSLKNRCILHDAKEQSEKTIHAIHTFCQLLNISIICIQCSDSVNILFKHFYIFFSGFCPHCACVY